MALKVGFIGSGKMATALARGFLQGKAVSSPAHVLASCPAGDAHLLDEVKALGCVTMNSNERLVRESDVVVLAVKPGVVPVVLREVRGEVVKAREKVVVSIAAGVTLESLESWLDKKCKLIRLMPNTPCIVREGVSVFARGTSATSADADLIRTLFSSVGGCEEVDEHLIDAVTGVSASGPAYMYLIIEAMADGGVKQGLPRDLAYRLAAQTMVGAGRMVLDSNKHPAVLKDEVCSPGGTTIAALDILEKGGLRTSLMQAVEAATLRSIALGR